MVLTCGFKVKTLFFVALTSLIFTSCTDDDYQKEVVDDSVALSAGTADFSNYVAVGNSLTAGYTDGALFKAGQENSIPNLVANKFAMAGGGDFTQPLMNDNNGGFSLGSQVIQEPRLYLGADGPTRLDVTPSDFSVIAGPYNNMGVPGAKSYHLGISGYGNMAGLGVYANPYFVRIASSPAASVIDDATAQNPTFFSLWIGANDVLRYSLAGGDGVDQTGNFNPATYGDADITDPNVFAFTYNDLVTKLTENGAKGVVLNLPDVTVIPYFTTVPYNPVPLEEDKVALLNGAFAQYNGGVQQVLNGYVANGVITQEIADAELAKRTINFVIGQNPVTIVDESLIDLSAYGIPNYRMATADDLILLPSKSFIGTMVDENPQLINGVSVPLADKWVLTKDEIMKVQTATTAYNTTIETLATAKDLAFVDVNTMMSQLADGGIMFDGFTMTNQYVFGNTFSLDGVHPTARGNAFIANEILKAIDAKYGSNFEVSENLNKAADFTTQYPATLQ